MKPALLTFTLLHSHERDTEMECNNRELAQRFCTRAQRLAKRSEAAFGAMTIRVIQQSTEILEKPLSPSGKEATRKISDYFATLASDALRKHVMMIRSRGQTKEDHIKRELLWLQYNILQALYLAVWAAHCEVANPRDYDTNSLATQKEIDEFWSAEQIHEFREKRYDDMAERCPELLNEAESCLT